MQSSPSLQGLLHRALTSEADEGDRNPAYIPDAIISNYFRQAAELWRRHYPTNVPITESIAQKLLCEIPRNHDDFTALILEVLFAGETFSIDDRLHLVLPSNFIFVFLILIFDLRKNGLYRVHSRFSKFFPSTGTSFNQRNNFYSVVVLGKYLASRLEELNEKYKPKKTAPTPEFLVYRDRTVLMTLSSELRQFSDQFKNRSLSYTDFHRAVLDLLREHGLEIEKISEVTRQHQVSLQIRSDCMALCGEINGGAIAVASDFIEAARIEPDTQAILKDLEVGIRTGVKPAEGCFLAEAWLLIQARAHGTSDGNTQLELFERALLNFEEDFHEKTTDNRPLFNACVAFPRQRNLLLSNKNCQTGTALLAASKALSYTLYLLTASLVESMAIAERLDFLRWQGLVQCDVTSAREAVNSGLSQFVEVRGKIQAVVNQLKGLPFLSADLTQFTLEDDTPSWEFPPMLGMNGLSPAALDIVRAHKINEYEIVRGAVIQVCSRTLCLNCGKAIAVKICEICQQVATKTATFGEAN
jgi:hypothetical protein